jgi:hypothetical protein
MNEWDIHQTVVAMLLGADVAILIMTGLIVLGVM